MAGWSIPIQQPKAGWKLRVLSGRSLGMEYDLPLSRYVLGSRPPANIVIADASIAPQHVTIDIRPDYIELHDSSGGRGLLVNDKRVSNARVVPGDHVTVGVFKFEFSNPNYKPPPLAASPNSPVQKFLALPLYLRVGIISLSIAALLYVLLATSENPNLVPVTLLAMAAAIPLPAICYLIDKYDGKRLSFYTLAITFVSGGTIGIIAAMIGFMVGEVATCGLILVPIFAGLLEEPAKLFATAWRWRHPGYDRPIDGLLLGAVSGFGFAVFETAGYGFTQIFTQVQQSEENWLSKVLLLMVLRGLSGPFGHPIWSGILAGAFWQCGRDLRRAVKARPFQMAFLWAVGLHAVWNASALSEIVDPKSEILQLLGFGFVILSAFAGMREFRRLLANKGYR
jgi:RsiW-degrading membrane proteinase PrsW (M82 family)